MGKITEGDEAEQFVFRVGEGASAVRVTVTAAAAREAGNSFQMRFEAQSVDEDMMSRQKPTRFGFTMVQPTLESTIRVEVAKWDAVEGNAAKTAWMSCTGFGVFNHFLPGTPEQFNSIEHFDVEGLADQLQQTGAEYFVFTIYQNSGWFNAPNAEYDRMVGWTAGERCSNRDLPMELADALAKRGIRLMLYVTAQTPNRDVKAQAAYGLPQGPADQPIDMKFAQKWAKVFQEWSDRYGEKVSGWWVDGCYEWVHFNDEIGAVYVAALQHGNPNAVVALNPGVLRKEWKPSNYTAGEINEPLEIAIDGRLTEDGQQRQILTFLGEAWGKANCRYTNEQWSEWVTKIREQGGAVTLDANSNLDPTLRPIGTMNTEQVEQLQAIFEAIQR